MLGPGDLVLCSGTLPPDTSFATRLDAAMSAGFAGISMWGRDYAAARAEGHRDAEVRAMLDDHGLAVAELDPAWWWLPGARETGEKLRSVDDQRVFEYDDRAMFAMAEAVGARSLNAVDVFGGPWTLDEAAEAFALLCDQAADHGLLVHLEALPWSRIANVSTAWDIVRRADRPNGGVAVDAWHFTRSGFDLDALAAVPKDRILSIQLDDGPATPEDDLVLATLHARRLPGEGQFDLQALLHALAGSAAPIGVEVFSDDLHALGPIEAARRAAEAARTVLDRSAAREATST